MQAKEHFLKFRVNDTGLEHIQQKKAELGIRSMAAYLRKMALEGICIQLDPGDELMEIRALLGRCGSNLKQRAEAMLFMREHKIESFEELVRRADEASGQADALLNSVKADEVRLQEIAVLKTHIINFSKAKPVFDAYKASGCSKNSLRNIVMR